ncbi:DUF692 domain-containing protein [Aurantivibrio plasticivorans]
MPRPLIQSSLKTAQAPAVGVGLRHAHYQDALVEASPIDFVEIHAENFFGQGGMIQNVLEDIVSTYDVSLHSTSLGLGSASGINVAYLTRLKRLADQINPPLISDHACFTWARWGEGTIHSGDLLPLEFTPYGLKVLVENVDRVQQFLGRQILVENISTYLKFSRNQIMETDFLVQLAEKTQCGLLVDLNNILVNGHNFSDQSPLDYAKQWLKSIPVEHVGEFHLAGSTPAPEGEMLIDDHAMPVSDDGWSLYEFASQRFVDVPALIEWDNHLPSWQTLLQQAGIARRVHSKYEEEGDQLCYSIR